MNFFSHPPKFEAGSDIRTFINNFESFCKSVEASEAAKRHAFLLALPPALKFDILETENENLYDVAYDELKKRTTAVTLCKFTQSNARLTMARRTQTVNETNRDFVSALVALGNQAFPEDNKLRNAMLYTSLLTGLRDKRLADTLQRENCSKEEPSFREASRRAINADDFTGKSDKLRDIDVALLKPKVDPVTDQLKRLAEEIKQLRLELNEVRNENKRYSSRRCYNCNEEGHFARNCRQRRPRTQDWKWQTSAQQPTSFPYQESEVNQDTITHRINTNESVLYKYANININGVSVFALVDTGATVSVVSSAVCKRLTNVKIKSCQSNLRFVGANGSQIQMAGLIDVCFRVAGIRTTASVYVSSDIAEECILGIDFLQNQNCVVNYKLMTLSGWWDSTLVT
uniref:Zinc finger protein ZF(CCHC)-17 n=1 Tax=Phallusia mammillata TaxID=59560 RepID=A0A6F9DYD9_9ASCI|nr:zinc finger protein ZF(CCHC)-17 [Phallusia mammillata]